MTKFIFVSGGVCSSLGKGVAASSIGALLEGRGLNTRIIKCDPYINVNAGTMSPFEHGEIYVTDDGAETDQDLGSYARFTKGHIGKSNSITTGQVYRSVIEKEREGRYEGRCVQVIPHITDEIKSRIISVFNEDSDTDVAIVEIGGTVGDIESIPFLEAARQIIHEKGRNNAVSVHLTLIPEIVSGELKTKPTQHSVKAMQEIGIQPDILICRAPVLLDIETRKKIALFTNVDPDSVFTSRNIDSTIYEIPLMFFEQKLDQVILKKMGVESRHSNLDHWYSMMKKYNNRKGKVNIGIVGKYMDLNDAYKSVYEALFHAGVVCGVVVEFVKVASSALEKTDNAGALLDSVDGVLIPGGFGHQGIEGLIKAASWARENKKPFFGIGQGMQVMIIEWCRNVLNWPDANSTEFNADTKYPVVCLPDELGVMRIGAGESAAEPGTVVFAAYNQAKGAQTHFWERYRNRYEFNNKYRKDINESGLKISALTPDDSFVNAVEWQSHWGVGVQFHPEFKSKLSAPAPLYTSFITAAKGAK